MDQTLPAVLKLSEDHDEKIQNAVHAVSNLLFLFHLNQVFKLFQTDGPHSEFWNSANVEVARDLASKYQITWTHMTSQSHHGKVKYIRYTIQFFSYIMFSVLPMENSPE